jgi:predicted transposase YdaD
MADKPFDPTLKTLVELDPASWPALFGRPTGPTEIIDADVATVSGAADKVLRVAARPPYLLHLEFVAGHDAARLPSRLHARHALLNDRHELRVRTGVVVLRPEADSPQLTGVYECSFPDEEPYLIFRYQVLRVWQLDPDTLLAGGPALLPLAPISAVTESELPAIIQEMGQRLSGRRVQKHVKVVWAATYVLLGLRYSAALAEHLFRGVVSMKESTTYQAILAEGLAEGRAQGQLLGAVAEARKVLRLLGDDLFGIPDAATAARIEQLADLETLERLLKRIRVAESWDDLLGPAPSRRGRRRS